VVVAVTLLAASLLAAASCSGSDSPSPEGSSDGPVPNAAAAGERQGALAVAAERAGVRVGGAVTADRLRHDGDYGTAVATHFSSITPENAMKWTVVRPGPQQWAWDDADTIVEFAEDRDLEVRGHTLVWGQTTGNGVPGWLTELEDPTEFRAAVAEGITTQVRRYRGRVDRWDVVNEPLDYAGGSLDDNVFLRRLGPGYIAEAFRLAHAADPDAELWLNEFGTELLPAKGDLLVSLVTQLVADGVPIDGVGFQSHMTFDVDAAPDLQAGVMARIRGLGLDVAVTELDVPVGPVRPEDEQVDLYRRVAASCLAQECVEITTWGVSDDTTWLDAEPVRRANAYLAAFPVPSRPLLLDAELDPKPAYDELVAVLRDR
jgi:endo-1,4-beta-xylanase